MGGRNDRAAQSAQGALSTTEKRLGVRRDRPEEAPPQALPMGDGHRCRAARECADGQYVLIDEHTLLNVDADTLTLTAGSRTIVHVPTSSVMIGASEDKLLLVPTTRAAAWAVQLEDIKAAVNALNEHGVVVATDAAREPAIALPLPATTAKLDEELAQMVALPGFRDYVTAVEAALERQPEMYV